MGTGAITTPESVFFLAHRHNLRQKPGSHRDDTKTLQAAYKLYTTSPRRHENGLIFDVKRGANCPQSDRRQSGGSIGENKDRWPHGWQSI